MVSQDKDMLSQITPVQNTQAAQDSRVSEGCSDSFAILDLAAFSEGNLSQEGMQRLATHVRQCETCRIQLASVIRDSQRSQSSGDKRSIVQLCTLIERDNKACAG